METSINTSILYFKNKKAYYFIELYNKIDYNYFIIFKNYMK